MSYVVFNKIRNASIVVLTICDMISDSVRHKKVLEMGNVFCLAFIGNELYLDESDIRNFCERCRKVMLITTSDALCDGLFRNGKF